MGFFTWTFANRKVRRTKSGGFAAYSRVPYYGPSTIVCPDGTLIHEPSYEGYGIWDGHDIFELVADWNKTDIPALFERGVFKDSWMEDRITPVALAWAGGDENEAIRLSAGDPILEGEIKRTIGIWLCFVDDRIPYPPKIVSTKNKRWDYTALPRSLSTQ